MDRRMPSRTLSGRCQRSPFTKPKDSPAVVTQPGIARQVAGGILQLMVHGTVELDNEPVLQAVIPPLVVCHAPSSPNPFSRRR